MVHLCKRLGAQFVPGSRHTMVRGWMFWTGISEIECRLVGV
jgi:hypothetical protein